MTIDSSLITMQNQTAAEQAAQAAASGTRNTELNQDMFLKLMLEQLKYQDPLNPMSNQDFLAQQAQFTQLNEMQKLNESIASNNTVQQCVSLIGKEVTLMDPDDPEKTIVGRVTEAVFDSNGSSIKVNGKDYPLGLVMNIREPGSSAETDETSSTGDETAATAQSSALGDLAGDISTIAKLAQFVISNVSKYIK